MGTEGSGACKRGIEDGVDYVDASERVRGRRWASRGRARWDGILAYNATEAQFVIAERSSSGCGHAKLVC